MELLSMADGWAPLTFWAPARTAEEEEGMATVGMAESTRLSDDDWAELSAAASEALLLGHRATTATAATAAGSGVSGGTTAGESSSETVHGDARLTNILARRGSGGFEVMFVDFGWSGVQGRSRSVRGSGLVCRGGAGQSRALV